MRAILLALGIILCATVATAQDTPPDVRAYNIDGKSYVCFVPADAQTLLQLRIDCPKIQLELDKYKELVNVKDGEVLALTNMKDNLSQQVAVYSSEVTELSKELASANAWYKNPWLWFGVGAVVGTGASIAVLHATRAK